MSTTQVESPHTTITAVAASVQRHITSHNPITGESIYVDAPALHTATIPGFGTASRSYATLKLPAELADDHDLNTHFTQDSVTSYTRSTDFTVPASQLHPKTGDLELGGANVINLDIEPGAIGHMHRTVSLDISTCVMGEVYNELDSGQKVLLKAGDHIIQRATMHRWVNASKENYAKVIAVLLPCTPIKVRDEYVKEEHRFK
ncbi:hypothetical protein EDB82DRAFT_428486 [Fusarium venenatum]|uniref:uncharacterized protein n=1 Tax=Fusarium venenatum TaxID=56646 RepID=UPI001D3422D0|nr:hypothetical protein EDB82DRAFT_428486 [Fusarium venenatum]